MFTKLFYPIVAVLAVMLTAGAANASLVASYQFEGNANDSSGNGNNGTFMNGATTTIDAQRGQVLTLDGTNDYVDCGTGPAITGTGLEYAWVEEIYS